MFETLKSSRDGKKAGHPVVILGGEHGGTAMSRRARALLQDVDTHVRCAHDCETRKGGRSQPGSLGPGCSCGAWEARHRLRAMLEAGTDATSFEMVVRRVHVDDVSATLDLDTPPFPEGREVPDKWLAKQVAWFAGLNDEVHADEQIRVAIYGDDGHRFKPRGRVRITVEPIP